MTDIFQILKERKMDPQPCILVYLKILLKFLALQASLAQTLDF